MFAPQHRSQPPHGSAGTSGDAADAMSPQAADIDSLRLLQGRREVRIRHGNEWYRLRHTRNDKLILTK